ncbi:MAG: hypothetical protein HC860_17120 [Alkalinema sp. RU_4_3]|nr:hypothetical protein [Alkalinema sp. RU_4_3]
MQFKPFWDQLADLGIELPEPYKILTKETPKGTQQISGQDAGANPTKQSRSAHTKFPA